MTEQERREESRKAVRRYLARRPGIALSHESIHRGLKRDGAFTEQQVLDALNHLIGRGHVESEPDGDGATLYYKITADGELYDERH
jgi:Fe2+ or Zn2+ uptake regulation protein